MLNPSKTEAIVFGTAHRLRTAIATKPVLEFAGVPLTLADSVHILGVTLDQSLTLNTHVTKIVSSCNHHIRALRHIRSNLTTKATTMIACSLINTRLDYCNSLLKGTSEHNIVRLQRVQNSLVRIVLRTRHRESITPHIRALHWLRIPERIDYKLATLTFTALKTGQPSYLSDALSAYAPTRVLRSGSRNLINVTYCSLKCASPAFCFSAPLVWNSLSDYVKSSDSLEIFKSRLKTELFARSG
jgi:hypothetical protein